MKVEITIDGQPVQTELGRTLVDVAPEVGVFIPTLCYVKGEACLGTCRVCSVKVNGAVNSACTVRVANGMEVEVNEPEITDMRKALVEFLFVEGNHNCPSCEKSGRCQLQAVGYETDMMVSRFPYRFPVRDNSPGSDKIWLERDRCIFCQRCVEFVRDQETGQKIFSIHGRGSTARIDMNVELANRMSDEQVQQAVDLCPVGTILKKRVGHDVPIGQRKFEVQTLRARTLNIPGAKNEPRA
ncbi:MAG: 2Fe-2S iron-sulfur cluster-binding protein [Pseudomonadota bacterium]|jgi:[NiFe] hydrogenase diaphorase moiety small subunit